MCSQPLSGYSFASTNLVSKLAFYLRHASASRYCETVIRGNSKVSATIEMDIRLPAIACQVCIRIWSLVEQMCL